jgi:hypothetical protein
LTLTVLLTMCQVRTMSCRSISLILVFCTLTLCAERWFTRVQAGPLSILAACPVHIPTKHMNERSSMSFALRIVMSSEFESIDGPNCSSSHSEKLTVSRHK